MLTQTDARREAAIAFGRDALALYEGGYLAKLGAQVGATACVETFDPSTAGELWSLPDLNETVVDAAVTRARAAQPTWERMPPAEKGALLLKCADALEEHGEAIARSLALETGKAISTECRGEVALMLSILRYFAGLGHEIKGRSIRAGHTLLGFTTHHPWGVIAGIVPWNVPLMFMAYKMAAPLMAGNTVVIKMPEAASATLCFCFEVIRGILPKGSVHFLSGSGERCGTALVAHEGVDKISFTGSVETGRLILGAAAKTMRPVTLELGGKSPMVILDDCDLDKAVEGIFGSMRFTRAGQSCTAASRIYVPHDRLDAYRAAIATRLSTLTIGDALSDSSQCGPVVTRQQQTRIDGYLEQAKRDSLTVDSFGIRQIPEGRTGWYVNPHVIINPDISHRVSQEEIFGPVTTLTGYRTMEEVTALSNATPFGLSASVWGGDITRCLSLARDFRAGIVQINQNAVMLPGFSYGGVGVSGQGKESSVEAMMETYMYEKTNIVNFG